MVNEVDLLVRLFVDKIGMDLATYTKMNNLWHTGCPREMRNDSSFKQCQPWEYVRRVATSRRVGEGCKKPEWWSAVFRRQVEECLFSM